MASKPIIELGQGSSGRRSRRTLTLVFVACFVMWLFGLSQWDVTSFQLLLLTTGGLLALVFGGLRRRRVVERRRTRVIRTAEQVPQTCVVIRRLGEVRDAASARWT